MMIVDIYKKVSNKKDVFLYVLFFSSIGIIFRYFVVIIKDRSCYMNSGNRVVFENKNFDVSSRYGL